MQVGRKKGDYVIVIASGYRFERNFDPILVYKRDYTSMLPNRNAFLTACFYYSPYAIVQNQSSGHAGRVCLTTYSSAAATNITSG